MANYIDWTLEEPQIATMFSSWGAEYTASSGTTPEGRPTTTLYENHKSSPLIVVKWGRGGEIQFKRSQTWMAFKDFVVGPPGGPMMFVDPSGRRFEWGKDPRSYGYILLDRQNNRSYGRLDPVRDRYIEHAGRKRQIGHVIAFADNINEYEHDFVIAAALVFRCMASF